MANVRDEPKLVDVDIDKSIEVDLDLGCLLVTDPNEISRLQLNANSDDYLRTLTRSNTQQLINRIFSLPFHRVDDVIVAELPKPSYMLPRSKHAPKPRSLTKWQAYSKEKGIVKKKKSRLVWDEIVKRWVPRYGYRRAEADNAKEWLLEVPKNADPYEDQFEKKSEAKSERVAKNELQRLRNIAKARKVAVPSAKGHPVTRETKTTFQAAVHVANSATASLGKFQPSIGKVKPPKGTGKKRQFEPMISNKEKARNFDVFEKIMKKRPKMDVEKTVERRSNRTEKPRRGKF